MAMLKSEIILLSTESLILLFFHLVMLQLYTSVYIFQLQNDEVGLRLLHIKSFATWHWLQEHTIFFFCHYQMLTAGLLLQIMAGSYNSQCFSPGCRLKRK